MEYILLNVVNSLLDFYSLVIVIWCILTWFRGREGSLVNDIFNALNILVKPYLSVIKSIVPSVAGIDFSPFIGVLLIQLLQRIITML